MRALLSVVLSLALVCVSAEVDPVVYAKEGSALPRAYVPPRIPMAVVEPTAMFEIPWWLGGYVASVNESSNWTLPLTYPSGGRTSVGSTLVIQNQGPYNITLWAQGAETIQGMDNYLVVADSTVQILAAQDWVVVSNTFGTDGTDGNYAYLQAQNASIQCWLGVGTSSPANQQCGDLTATNSLTVGSASVNSIISSVRTVTGTGQLHGIRNSVVMVQSGGSGDGWGIRNDVTDTGNTGPLGNFQGLSSTMTHVGAGTVVNMRAVSAAVVIQDGSGAITNVLSVMDGAFVYNSATSRSSAAGYRGIAMSIGGGATVTTYTQFQGTIQSAPTSGTLTNSVMFSCPASSNGGTNNYCLWANTNSADSSGGFCAGTAGDVCMWRAAAGVWTFGTNQDLRIPGYLTVGSSSAPSNTNNGAISTTLTTPALQAFGAVTANAASGLLAFTVSTAAQTCGTAVVTNTNVVAASYVQLTIQGYSGTLVTNGIPAVSRLNTAGSSAGSFTLSLCNIHATNALSGNLYVAFWVLN